MGPGRSHHQCCSCIITRPTSTSLARRAFVLLCLLIASVLITPPASSADSAVPQPRTLVVGVYQNPPSVFYDEGGKVQGFFIDVLEHIAQQQGWQLSYVKDTWPGLVQNLERGAIDMIAGMAYNQERDIRFDFTSEPVFINWGQVYVKDTSIQSLLDLEGKRIVGLKQDIYTQDFRTLTRQFALNTTFIEVDDYREILQLVEDGEADAGITSRSSGMQMENSYRIHRSPIVCCSKEVHYAVKQGQLGDTISALNRRLAALKQNNGSPYFESLNYWFGEKPAEFIPQWLLWLLSGTLTGSLLLFCGLLELRRQVRDRTASLQEAHDQLETRVMQRTAELKEKNTALLKEVGDHRKTQKKLQHMVQHDPLTGLPNRRWFSTHLQEDIHQARMRGHALAVMFLDLDDFKQANDRHGHDFGDTVLVSSAQRIRNCLRDTDRLARLGGDEFIIVLPQVQDQMAAEAVARKILDSFQTPFQASNLDCYIGISIGISLFPKHGQEAETLLNHADDAMYHAKRAGRNRYSVYATGQPSQQRHLGKL